MPGKLVIKGIVLRVTPTKEADYILTLLTDALGKVAVVARGARRKSSRIAAGCGLEVVDVNRLLKSFEMLQQMTKAMTKGKLRGLGGMMGGMPNMNRMHGFGRKKRLK